MEAPYVGRFAPTPSGPLHEGSLVAALASWLDARAHGGTWFVRIEDLDTPRNAAGAAETILAQLQRCDLQADAPVALQSDRVWRYEEALHRLLEHGFAYPCGCTRAELAAANPAADGGDEAGRPRHGERVYPGTCRSGLHGRPARSYRLRTEPGRGEPALIEWTDRRLGAERQNVAEAVGDFVLKRADGVWAYQLAVVVDDAAQGITDVVRGADLAGNTARQILLQRRLGVATPRYLHTPLVLGSDGEKLSKQNGAAPVRLDDPLAALRRAGAVLGIEAGGAHVADWLAEAVVRWRVVMAP